MMKMITAAFFAVLIGIEAGHAAAACPDGYITCAEWCRTYRINTPRTSNTVSVWYQELRQAVRELELLYAEPASISVASGFSQSERHRCFDRSRVDPVGTEIRRAQR